MLVLHPVTALRIQALKKTLPHALLLSGPEGSGLLTIARSIVQNPSDVLQPRSTKGDIDPTGTISIDSIRDLYNRTRTKFIRKRIIIIDDADRMSSGAQNAFLKLLEEPNSSTYFILTTHHPELLLPTVRSRTQQLSVQPITTEQTRQLIRLLDIHDPTKQSQLLFLADGLPAKVHRLAANAELFEQHARIITDARTLITAPTYQKLRLIQQYKQNRDTCMKLLDSAIAILRFTLQSKPRIELVAQIDRLLEAREKIAANQSIPLQLASAVL